MTEPMTDPITDLNCYARAVLHSCNVFFDEVFTYIILNHLTSTAKVNMVRVTHVEVLFENWHCGLQGNTLLFI